ncbi:MAG: signal peptidase II [Desulfopila sp.]
MNQGLLLPTVFCAVTFLDQYSKYLAWKFLFGQVSVALFWGTIQLECVINFHGFLGFLAQVPSGTRYLLLTFGVGFLLCMLCLLLLLDRLTFPQRLAITLLLAGGVSNLADRLLHDGGVIDFFRIGVGQVSSGIFNFADISILVGAFALGCSLAHSKIHIFSR